jgi:hypothetical protein
MFLRFIRDLGGLVPHNGAMVFLVQPSEEAGGGFQRLAFRSSAHLAFSPEDVAGGAALIVYDVRPDKKNEGVFDLLRGDGFPDETATSSGGDLSPSVETEAARSTFVLCTDVHALIYTFYDEEGQEYETWDSVNGPETQRKRAPAMIQVTLDLAGPSRREAPLRFQTRINLPITKVSTDGPF